MKKSLLIATPYLNNIGGTEIETVTTAIYLFDSKQFDTVSIFTPNEINRDLFKKIINNRSIHFFNYPKWLSSPFLMLLDRLFYKLKFKNSLSKYIYWKYKSLSFSNLFILAYPKSVYFFSILNGFSKRKNISAKITLWHYKNLEQQHIPYYKKIKSIIVFNKKQSDFWENKYGLKNVLVSDIIIPNEDNLLKIKPINFNEVSVLQFGYLGRISREKNIEDMICLLAYLNKNTSQKTKLTIQGPGDIKYIESLKILAKNLGVENNVSISTEVISPVNTHLFYAKIHVFLVMSLHEGGPITALEAAAAGRMILSYHVGAMHDRFNTLPLIINNTFEDLCQSAITFIKLKNTEKNSVVLEVSKLYKSNLSNKSKGIKLLKIIKNES